MTQSSLEKAKDFVIEYFDENEGKVFRYSDLRKIFNSQREAWSLAKSTSFKNFLNFIVEEKILEVIQLSFFHREESRFIKSNISLYELALSLKDDSYLSHHTAVYLHGLTDIIPENIYVNSEQSPKRSRGSDLTQEKIDLAFRNSSRRTKNKAEYKGKIIWRLNGMYTGCYGVEEINYEGSTLRVTNLERTLVDIAVRPVYSGGVSEVLKAYRFAMDELSLKRLIRTLEKIGYIYPYHQVIGFYLENAGVQINFLEPFLGMGLHYDFYLTHQMKKVAYSERWKLYYPEGLIS